MKLLKSQKGDTILEVLIAVTVLSLILTTAFALANRNSQANRQANERGEALKLAQAEMEKLKLYLSGPGAPEPDEGSYFCVNEAADTIIPLASTSDVFPGDRNVSPDFSGDLYSKDECKSDVGNSSEGNPNAYFYYRLVHRGSGNLSNTYTSIIRWPAVTGNGIDESTVVHRIYPDLTSLIVPVATEPVVLPPACLNNNNIAVALDRSGSMKKDFSARENRMQVSKRILKDFFAAVLSRSSTNNVALTAFSDDEGGYNRGDSNSERDGGRALDPEIIQPLTTSLSNLNSAVNEVEPGPERGGTDLIAGLNIADRALDGAPTSASTHSKIIILLSDGHQEYVSTTEGQVINRANQLKNSGVVIYTIGIYPEGNNAGAALLRGIASSPSNFTSVNNESQFDRMLDTILTNLSCT